MDEILKQFTPNNIAGGSYERLSIASLINNLDTTKSVVLQRQQKKIGLSTNVPRVLFITG